MTTQQFALENMLNILERRTGYLGRIESNEITFGFAGSGAMESRDYAVSCFVWVKHPWIVSIGENAKGNPAIIITSTQFDNE